MKTPEEAARDFCRTQHEENSSRRLEFAALIRADRLALLDEIERRANPPLAYPDYDGAIDKIRAKLQAQE